MQKLAEVVVQMRIIYVLANAINTSAQYNSNCAVLLQVQVQNAENIKCIQTTRC